MGARIRTCLALWGCLGDNFFTFSHSTFLILPVWATNCKTNYGRTHSPFLVFQAKSQKELRSSFSRFRFYFWLPLKFTLPFYPSTLILWNPPFLPPQNQTTGERERGEATPQIYHSGRRCYCSDLDLVHPLFFSIFFF